MAAPPAAGGAEIVGQVSGTEVELEGTAVAPDEVTSFVVFVLFTFVIISV